MKRVGFRAVLFSLYAIVGLSLAAVACAGSDGGNAAPRSPSDGVSSAPPEAGMGALMVGRLAADPVNGCLGIIPKDASPGQKPRCDPPILKWPRGVQERIDPVQLEDLDGTIIAREGNLLHLGGGNDDGVFVVHKIENISSK